jgi:hypothetical protein
MTTQSILKTMEQTVKEILIALYEAVARFGCGLEGIPYEN